MGSCAGAAACRFASPFALAAGSPNACQLLTLPPAALPAATCTPPAAAAPCLGVPGAAAAVGASNCAQPLAWPFVAAVAGASAGPAAERHTGARQCHTGAQHGQRPGCRLILLASTAQYQLRKGCKARPAGLCCSDQRRQHLRDATEWPGISQQPHRSGAAQRHRMQPRCLPACTAALRRHPEPPAGLPTEQMLRPASPSWPGRSSCQHQPGARVAVQPAAERKVLSWHYEILPKARVQSIAAFR